MKRFDELTPERKVRALDKAFEVAVRKLYQGGVTSDQDIRAELARHVKDLEERYFGDGMLCGCFTCLEQLARFIKEAKYSRVKEVVLVHARTITQQTFYMEPGDRHEDI